MMRLFPRPRKLVWWTSLPTLPEDFDKMARHLGNARIYTITLIGSPHMDRAESLLYNEYRSPDDLEFRIRDRNDAVNASLGLLEEPDFHWYLKIFYA